MVFNSPLFGFSGGGYSIKQSVIFDSASSDYATWTPAGAGTGSGSTWTFSTWIKRGNISTTQYFFSANAADPYFIGFNSSDQIVFFKASGGTPGVTTSAVYRDVTAWYHLVVSNDGTNWKVYINGVEQATTITGTPGGTPFGTAVAHYLGRYTAASNYFDGYLSETRFIDGQALTPSSFGKNDLITNQWIPIRYSGTYGTNGFYLKFSDATHYGLDSSGNGNSFTDSGFTTSNQKSDSPTRNTATINPLGVVHTATYSNGNLSISSTGYGEYSSMVIEPGMKAYAEWKCGTMSSGVIMGIQIVDNAPVTGQYPGGDAYTWGYKQDGQKITNTTLSAYGATYTTNDVIGMAFDNSAGTLEFFKNGTSQGTAFSSLDTTKRYYVAIGTSWGATYTGTFAFSSDDWAYSAPTGFKELSVKSIATPSIKNASKHFDAVLYSGTNATHNITGVGFQPDLVWIKDRGTATRHCLFDSIRGANHRISSNLTQADTTDTDCFSSFDSDGFTLGADTTNNLVNYSATNYVAWCWEANGAGAANTDGTTSSTVSANTTAGFSIVKYTGTGANATVGHGLGVAPSLVIIKAIDNTSGWTTYHSGIGATKYLQLNTTAAAATLATAWQNTAPTTSVFSLGSETSVNQNTFSYVAYCFADVDGYSKAFSYKGNGNADGTYVELGFEPKFILVRHSDAASDWWIFDTIRDSIQPLDYGLLADTTGAETTASGAVMDVLSNGFKLRGTHTNINQSNGTYIGIAFAKEPANYSDAA